MLASVVIVMKMATVAGTIEVGVNRVRRTVGMKTPIVSRTATFTSSETHTNLLKSFGRYFVRDVFPVSTGRDGASDIQVELAEFGGVVVRNCGSESCEAGLI